MVDVCMASKFLKGKEEFYRKKKKCNNTDIVLVIRDRGKDYPICRSCWIKIANSSVEWGKAETEGAKEPFLGEKRWQKPSPKL